MYTVLDGKARGVRSLASRCRVLKNFPTETELAALVASRATGYHFRRLDNFWLLEYEVAARDDRALA
jgi:hypothetical protein